MHLPRARTVVLSAIALIALVLVAGGGVFGFTLWSASSTILNPPGPGDVGTLDACRDITRRVWGDDCGRLTKVERDRLEAFNVASPNGYTLSGWLIRTGGRPASGVLLYVPGGGSDRREASRYLPLMQGIGLDLAVFDPVCQGLSPCPVPGLSYGARESIDVAAAASALRNRYDKVVLMGSSMGALSTVRALPRLSWVRGAVLENPMLGLEPLLRDAEQSKGMPDALVEMLAGLVRWRGTFPAVPEAQNALAGYDGPPLLFIHSRSDRVVPFTHSEALAKEAGGAASTWFPQDGDHGAVWNANRDEFERRVREFVMGALR